MNGRVDFVDEVEVPTLPFAVAEHLSSAEARRLAVVVREIADAYEYAGRLAEMRKVTLSDLGYQPRTPDIRRLHSGRLDVRLAIVVTGDAALPEVPS